MRNLNSSVVVVCFFLFGAYTCPSARAQTPSVLYTWDQSFGESVGPNVEGWAFSFGGNSVTLDNTINGTMGVTETGAGAAAGTDWAISDSFNRIKESLNPKDYGGLDLTGLSGLQLDLGQSGSVAESGQIFAQVGPGSSFRVLGPITVNPGAVATYSVPLSGLAPNEIDAIRTIGIQVFNHAADGNLNWKVNEIRSVGTPLQTRRVADYPVGSAAPSPAAPFEGAIFNFDADQVTGHTAGAQDSSGMSYNSADGALEWHEATGSPGAAVTWGNGNGVGYYAPTEFSARPYDFSNYAFAKIRLLVQSTITGEDVDVQFYTQGAGFSYHTAGPDQHIAADGQYHDLFYPLSGISDLAETQFYGINLGSHTGVWDVRVDNLEFITNVPEPVSVALLGSIGVLGLIRRKAEKRGG